MDEQNSDQKQASKSENRWEGILGLILLPFILYVVAIFTDTVYIVDEKSGSITITDTYFWSVWQGDSRTYKYDGKKWMQWVDEQWVSAVTTYELNEE